MNEEHTRMVHETESFRRERPSMDAQPLVPYGRSPSQETIMDYGEAGTLLALGIHHWDESIPGGQKMRTELAAQMIVEGVLGTLAWLRAKGYDVPLLTPISADPTDQAIEALAADMKQRVREKAAAGKAGWQDSLVGCLQGYFKHMSGGNLTDAANYLAFLRAHGLTSTPVQVKGEAVPAAEEFPLVHATGPLGADSYVVSEGSSVTVDEPGATAQPGDSPIVKEGLDVLDAGFNDRGASDPKVDDALRQEYEASGSFQLEQGQRTGPRGTASPELTLHPTNSWPFSGPAGEGPSDPAPEHPDDGPKEKPQAVEHVPVHYPPSER